MSNEILIKVENVSKKFCRSLKKSLKYGVNDILYDINPFASALKENRKDPTVPAGGAEPAILRPLLRDGEFWAVNDVSFELRRGECLGLIGRNGAGKTTLLKIINGLIKPDAGNITLRGRISALIALGAGFNPILTGRENIYVNGSVLGLTKREIGEKIEEIIDFADIRDFIDAPVQSYSSGMSVRLGFAVATALDPDVLILDEVLAVGDAAFRNKCYRRMAELMEKTACIFVAHDINLIGRITQKCVLLSKGNMIASGETAFVLEKYQQMDEKSDRELGKGLLLLHKPLVEAKLRIECQASKQMHGCVIIRLVCEITSEGSLPDLLCRVLVSCNSESIMEWNSGTANASFSLHRGNNDLVLTFAPVCLARGTYTMNMVLNDSKGLQELLRCNDMLHISVSGSEPEIVRARLKLHSINEQPFQ